MYCNSIDQVSLKYLNLRNKTLSKVIGEFSDQVGGRTLKTALVMVVAN